MKRGLQVERKGERKGGDKNGKGERSGVQQKSRVEGEGKHTKGGELKEFFLRKSLKRWHLTMQARPKVGNGVSRGGKNDVWGGVGIAP